MADIRLIQSLRLSATVLDHASASPGLMTKTLTMEVQRKNAERQLFGARRALSHLVELYDSGQWKSLYREDTFAEAVRQARQAVDHWTNVMAKSQDA
jgi:hypothetical protein